MHGRIYRTGALIGAVMFIATACTGSAPGAASTPAPATVTNPSAARSPLSTTGTPAPITTTAASAAVDKGGGAGSPVTLRLRTLDAVGSPAAAYVAYFTDLVAMRSNGNITIRLESNDFRVSEPEPEQRILEVVEAGGAELALLASRAFDKKRVTSLQAIQAPFLVTDRATLARVVVGDIATLLLSGLPAAGLEGLGLWPEDFRHPFSYTKPLLRPADFKGIAIRRLPSAATDLLLQALGAKPTFLNGDEYAAAIDHGEIGAAEAGLRQIGTLPRPAIATGNVTFFPKVDVLIANRSSIARLTASQQSVLRSAVAEMTQHVLDTAPPEADLAREYCLEGGTVVLAPAAALGEFMRAAQPAYDVLEKDPLTKDLIVRIRGLNSAAAVPETLLACDPAHAAASPSPVSQASPATLPPNGVYRVVNTREELIAAGASLQGARAQAGAQTLTFENGTFRIHGEQDPTAGCGGPAIVKGDVVRLEWTSGPNCGGFDEFRWTFANGELTIVLTDGNGVTGGDLPLEKLVFGLHPWKKIK